jgi:uncharacterized protein YqjF (DUF2071 family)
MGRWKHKTREKEGQSGTVVSKFKSMRLSCNVDDRNEDVIDKLCRELKGNRLQPVYRGHSGKKAPPESPVSGALRRKYA